MRIYRLTKAKYAASAFSGIGGLRSAGRWHRAGTPIVYASDAPASALLEVLAHTEASALLAHSYVLFAIDLVPERHLLVLEPAALPSGWRAPLWPPRAQALGVQWFDDADSVVLEVPSAIVPRQRNYLINPRHPLFEELSVTGPAPFEIDPRLG